MMEDLLPVDWQTTLAGQWAKTLHDTQYTGIKLNDLRANLADLIIVFVETLTADPLRPNNAQPVGVTLVEMGFKQPMSLGITLDFLGDDLITHITHDDKEGLYRRLPLLLSVVGVSFLEEVREVILTEQEAIRLSLMRDIMTRDRRLKMIRDIANAESEEVAEELQIGLLGFTPRQREVLALMVDGLSKAEIANQLGITVGTAGNHIGRIISKLQVKTRDEAVERAVRFGLV